MELFLDLLLGEHIHRAFAVDQLRVPTTVTMTELRGGNPKRLATLADSETYPSQVRDTAHGLE